MRIWRWEMTTIILPCALDINLPSVTYFQHLNLHFQQRHYYGNYLLHVFLSKSSIFYSLTFSVSTATLTSSLSSWGCLSVFTCEGLRTIPSSQFWSSWHYFSATLSASTVLRHTSIVWTCGASSWTTSQPRLRAHRSVRESPGGQMSGQMEVNAIEMLEEWMKMM